MRLIDRYLLREFLVPLAFCLCGFLIFWTAFNLSSELDDLQQKHLLALDIAEYYLFRIPEFLPVALPVALLLALLYATTNHARHNELTAIRAAGVSLWRLCVPYLAVGLAATMGLFAFNELAAPKTAQIAEEILARRLPSNPSTADRRQVSKFMVVNSRDQRWWLVGTYKLDTGEMFNVNVTWRVKDGSWQSIDADYASRSNGVWTFVGNVMQTIEPKSLPLKLPKIQILAKPEFTETLDEITSQVFITRRHDQKARTRRADVPVHEIINYMRLVPDPNIRSWLMTKLQGRIAGPCACLIVILIGVPFGATPGRRSVFVGVAASIVIFFAYFILQQLGFVLGEAGRLTPWIAAWLPNFVFGGAGLWMMLRVK